MSAPPALAALANGTSGHAMDFDDTVLFTTDASIFGVRMHPSVPILAAALAVAEPLGASGSQLISAFVYGFEISGRVTDSISREHYKRGFHPTGTINPLGAAAAAGQLLRLDGAAMTRALSIAASLGSGIRENYGTDTKPLHAGRAAEAGVLAAELAQRGFSASPEALEGKRGFFLAQAGGFDEGQLVGSLGQPFYVHRPGALIKPYPSGTLVHPAIDLALELSERHDIQAEAVQEIIVASNSNLLGSLIHDLATTGLEAKFSTPFCVAIALVKRRVGIPEFLDQVVQRADVQALMRRVRFEVDPELEALGYDRPRTRLTIRMRDGQVYSGRADTALGNPEKPLTEQALRDKFLACGRASPALQPGAGSV